MARERISVRAKKDILWGCGAGLKGYSDDFATKVFDVGSDGGVDDIKDAPYWAKVAVSGADGTYTISVPANSIVHKVLFLVLVAFSGGSPAINVGDGSTADGFLPTAKITYGTPGMYGVNADDGGAYLWDSGNVHTILKYYDAADTIDCVVSGTPTAGSGVCYALITKLI